MNKGIRRGIGLDSAWPHANGSNVAALVDGQIPAFRSTAEGSIDFNTLPMLVGQPVTTANPTAGLKVQGPVWAENDSLGLTFVGTQYSGGSSTIDLRSFGGSPGAETVSTSGTNLGGMHIGGWNTTGNGVDCAQFYCTATQDFSSSQSGTQWNFWTTQNGTNTKNKNFVIDHDGTLDLGATGLTNTASRTEAQINPSVTQTFATTGSMSHKLLEWAGTDSWQVNPNILSMFSAFNVAGTIKNAAGTSLTWGLMTAFNAGPNITVDTQTGANIQTFFGFNAAPTVGVANSGTYTSGAYKGFASQPTANGTGCTLTTATHFIVADVAGSNATVTNQFGIDIPALSRAGTSNVGIRCTPPIVKPRTVVTVTANAATIPVNVGHAKLTNSSAAGMTITLPTTGALDGQELIVSILDATAVAQTVTFTNGENGSTNTVPSTYGSTSIYSTYRLIFNGGTSKWTYEGR